MCDGEVDGDEDRKRTNERYTQIKSGNGKMLVCVMIAIKMKYGCYSVQRNRITYFYMRKHYLLLAEGVRSV